MNNYKIRLYLYIKKLNAQYLLGWCTNNGLTHVDSWCYLQYIIHKRSMTSVTLLRHTMNIQSAKFDMLRRSSLFIILSMTFLSDIIILTLAFRHVTWCLSCTCVKKARVECW